MALLFIPFTHCQLLKHIKVTRLNISDLTNLVFQTQVKPVLNEIIEDDLVTEIKIKACLPVSCFFEPGHL